MELKIERKFDYSIIEKQIIKLADDNKLTLELVGQEVRVGRVGREFLIMYNPNIMQLELYNLSKGKRFLRWMTRAAFSNDVIMFPNKEMAGRIAEFVQNRCAMKIERTLSPANSPSSVSMPSKTRLVDQIQVKSPYSLFSQEDSSEISQHTVRLITNREYHVEMDPTKVSDKLTKELAAAQKKGNDEIAKPSFPQKEGVETRVFTVTTEALPQTSTACAQGKRPTMEDQHIATTFSFRTGSNEIPVIIQGVLDGHGGDLTAKFGATHIVAFLIKRLEQYNRTELTDVGIWNALKLALVDLSRSCLDGLSGSTVNISLQINGEIWIVNLGDSRAIIMDGSGNTMQVSEDAKPADAKYLKGIHNRGGYIQFYGVSRVNGRLAVARSLGDHHLGGVISSRPKIIKLTRPKDGWTGYHLLHATDGIFDVATSKQAGAFINECFMKGMNHEAAARELVQAAFKTGSNDNSTVVITAL
jgi:serine/threonine protein phosphatase PrpC